MHCHHEKTIVIDERVAFVGGIDLTSESGDRYDSSQHPARGHSRLARRCASVVGPGVADVAEHFRMRWHEVTGETLYHRPHEQAGEIELQIVRTVPERIYPGQSPRRVPDPRVLPAGPGGGGAAHLPRKAVSLVARDRDRAHRQARPPAHPEFRLRRAARPNRTPAATTPEACSGNWSKPTPTQAGWSHARCTPAAAIRPTRSTSTPRSGSSTTPG